MCSSSSTDDVLAIFVEYKRTWAQRLAACEDNSELKLTSLETMVDELLEHNELLVSTILDLQKEAANRAHQMERRLAVSAKATEEVVVNLDKYERQFKHLVSQQASQIDAGDIIEELNNHIEALKFENNFLREKNENLEHDLGNLLEMVKFERSRSQALEKNGDRIGDANSQESGKCLTFCDSVNPEDVFGPIESMGDDFEVNESTNEPHSKLSNEKVAQLKSFAKPHIRRTPSNASIASSSVQMIIEEKELLIVNLQTHLQTISKELELKDQVVKNIETKLDTKRAESGQLKVDLSKTRSELETTSSKCRELEEREKILNDHKRSLMTRLDEESEANIKSKEEVLLLTRKLIDSNQQLEYQATTIEHLKEAIINKTKALSGSTMAALVSQSSAKNGSAMNGNGSQAVSPTSSRKLLPHSGVDAI